MSNNISQLEKSLGYTFQNIALLERALTHRSWAYEKMPFGDEEEIRGLQNESFEFVGDAVLGLAVVEYLFNKNPNATEGELTLMKHHLVSAVVLAKLAQKLNLGDFLRVGRGEEKTGGRRKNALLADTLEAVIAAIFFDSGYISARAFVQKILKDEFKKATPTTSIDYKTLLQETLQAEKRTAPTYHVIKTEGPPHARTFFVEATWEDNHVRAKGSSIKSAEMSAASLALKKLNAEKDVKSNGNNKS
jgi:ribonuclease III